MRVAVIGVGGLGGPAARALARAGVALSLFDGDVVELHNLPRQILFGEADLGQPKAEAAARRLRALVPACDVRAVSTAIDGATLGLLAGHALWLDGTDRLASKLFFSDSAVAARQPLVHAGAVRFGGQVLAIVPGEGPCLRCLLGGEATGCSAEAPGPPRPLEETFSEPETCSSAGILGPVVGVLGAEMARLALRWLGGEPDLAGQLVTYDALAGSLRATRLSRRDDCGCCGHLGSPDRHGNRPAVARVSLDVSLPAV